jgi:hypothetical protein
MVQPHTVLDSMTTALKESDSIPDATSYATFELDTDGGQSNVRPPVIEVTIIDTVRSRPHNTDFVDYATDGNDNHIGRIYHALFEMQFQIDVWTAEGGNFNHYDLGNTMQRALYRYDANGRGDPLPDPDDPQTRLDDIDRFTIGDGSPANDLSMTPALRRWRQTGEVWFHEEINTATEYGPEDYVVSVVGPSDGNMESGDDVAIEFNAT